MKKDIKVSIICLTYNHEKFIRKCLEGFVCQKTTFNYIVIIHDDASTDNTADIIKTFVDAYPDLFIPIYEKENQYSKKVAVVRDIISPYVKGEYVAYCEGDDYWDDPNKLQMQVDALESNTDLTACFTKVSVIDADGMSVGRSIPTDDLNGGILSQEMYMKHTFFPELIRGLPWQVSGLLIKKNIWENYLLCPPLFAKIFDVGDQPLFFYIGLQGPVYYLEKSMSCYRRDGNNGSWTGRINNDTNKLIQHIYIEIHGLMSVDRETDYRYHEYAIKGIRNRLFQMYKAQYDIKSMKSKNMRPLFNAMSKKQKLFFNFYFISSVLRNIKRKLESSSHRNK